jgi:cytochrome c oxidase subunit II
VTGSLDPQGPVAEAMADLWWLMLALGVAVFVVFAVLLAVALVRRPAEEVPSRRVTRWIVGWGVVGPAAVIIVVFAATVWAMRVLPEEAPADALVIDVIGHRWWYEVHYPDQGISTEDELHLPTGRPIALRLTSADVIHSFWVPSLAGKQDMLPDGVNTLVLQADEAGEHVSRCAEFCGLNHTDMALRVVAEPPDAFDAWVADQQPTALDGGRTAPTGDGAALARTGGTR